MAILKNSSRVFRAVVPIGLIASQIAAGGTVAAQSGADLAGTGCRLDQIAFCDTFDAPSPNGQATRSGDLDGVVWGVSRATSDDNPPQGREFHWNASTLDQCGAPVKVAPPRDVQICNGELVESVSDGGAQVVLAMYPRQPFDFAGRTGKIVFDVSNDTQGSHMAWPEVVVTDQPVPAPFEDAPGLADYARNSFGVQFSAACTNGATVPNGQGDSWTVNSMFTTSNYAFNSVRFNRLGCVNKSPGVSGPLNHVEIDISPNHVDVFATDPGGTALIQLASADVAMPLTRGLVWIEDAHYNADKDPGTQANHTFAWDNFGFDGPVLPRDLGFDVLDATSDGTSSGNLGYLAPAAGLALRIPNVHNLENASAALLEFTWWPHQKSTITYTANGNPPHTLRWPYGDAPLFTSQTLAVEVPVGELVGGENTFAVSISGGDGDVSLANVDLILVAAGGVPVAGPQAQ